MPLFIPDKFDDTDAQFPNWDTVLSRQADKGYLANQRHVDLRIMQNTDLSRPRPLNDLELIVLNELETNPNYSPQIDMEREIDVKGEGWAVTGTGFSAATTAKGTVTGRKRLQITHNAAAIAMDIKSQIPYDTADVSTTPIDISAMDSLSIVIQSTNGNLSRNGYVAANSYVYLTSRTDADLSNATGRSAQVFFTANTSGVNQELRVPISAFAGGTFDPTRVTGIQIHLDRAATTNNSLINIAAVRAVKSTWTERPFDMNTRLQTYEPTIPLDFTTIPNVGVPLIRGVGNPDDPKPADGSLNFTFNVGGEPQWNATGANFNKIDLYFREVTTDATHGSWIKATLRYNSTGTFVDIVRQDYANPTTTDVGLVTLNTGVTLERMTAADQNAGRYLFNATLIGNKFTFTLYKIDAADSITSTVWQGTSDSTNWTFRQGRVGIDASAFDFDMSIDDFSAASIAYATATSRVFSSLTPVDGAQIQAVFAEDANLWNSFYGTDLFLDLNKTTTGRGSYSSAIQLMSNQFLLEDWLNTYLEMDIWVPITVTELNQPEISIVGGGSTIKPNMPTLQGGQWNSIHIPLEEFTAFLTGIPYVVVIEPRKRDLQLGIFWVDNMRIMRRLISWMVRAKSDGTWREFRELVNDPTGAVHLPVAERGTQLQVQATALREDAWIASFHLFPHYAELGLPVTDLGFETH